ALAQSDEIASTSWSGLVDNVGAAYGNSSRNCRKAEVAGYGSSGCLSARPLFPLSPIPVEPRPSADGDFGVGFGAGEYLSCAIPRHASLPRRRRPSRYRGTVRNELLPEEHSLEGRRCFRNGKFA